MPAKHNFSFNRKSALKLKSEIQDMFANSDKTDYKIFKSINYYKLNVSNGSVKVFISVPKKCLNKATDRNQVKRRIREAIRLNYHSLKLLCKTNNIELFYGVVWLRDYICEYDIIEQNIVLSLQDLYNNIYEKIQNP